MRGKVVGSHCNSFGLGKLCVRECVVFSPLFRPTGHSVTYSVFLRFSLKVLVDDEAPEIQSIL